MALRSQSGRTWVLGGTTPTQVIGIGATVDVFLTGPLLPVEPQFDVCLIRMFAAGFFDAANSGQLIVSEADAGLIFKNGAGGNALPGNGFELASQIQPGGAPNAIVLNDLGFFILLNYEVTIHLDSIANKLSNITQMQPFIEGRVTNNDGAAAHTVSGAFEGAVELFHLESM